MKKYSEFISLALGTALVVYPIARVSEVTGLIAIGGAGFAFLALSLAWHRARAGATIAIALIAIHYALTLHAARVDLDVYSVLFGLGLFLLFEATDIAIGLADLAPMTRGALARRAIVTIAVAATGALLGVVVILGQSLFTAGVAGVVIGALCTLGIVALPLWLAQTSRVATDRRG